MTTSERDAAGDSTGSTDFVSYAQNQEDVVLWRALGHVPDGRYVDVGAADPVIDSVTLALYERGWRGIDIEPVPSYAAALVEARPDDVVVACGIGAGPGTRPFTVVEGTGLSTFDSEFADSARERAAEIPDASVSEIDVPIRTLDDVLDEHLEAGDDIHILKIDIEGLEGEALAGIDLDRWRPWVLVVEATEPGSTEPSHTTWEPGVLDAGYQFCLFDGVNRFYVHDDHAALKDRLSYPACAHDLPFRRWHDDDLRRQLERSNDEVARREQHIDELRGELAERHGQLEGMQRQLEGMQRQLEGMQRQLDDTNAQLDASRDEVERRERLIRSMGAELQQLHADRQAVRDHHRALTADYRSLSERTEALQSAYDTVVSSVSWRVTEPLRRVRERQLGEGPTGDRFEVATPATPVTPPADPDIRVDASAAFYRRLCQAADLLDPDAAPHRIGDSAESTPTRIFADALARTSSSTMSSVWLSYVVATATYPDESVMRAEERLLRRLGPTDYVKHLGELFDGAVDRGQALPVDLDPVAGQVVVDVTHTAQHDLHTGIQRVVRETCERWLDLDRIVPVWWDYGPDALRRLGDDDVERLHSWRERLTTSDDGEPEIHDLDDGPDAIVVPWRSHLLLPELAAEPQRTEGYRTLASSGVIDRFSVIGYDMIPVTAAETVTEGMSHRFSLYLSMVKRADRLAAISEAAAGDFRGFNTALESQGLSGPDVEAHLLPPSPTHVAESEIASVRETLGLGARPMVLVVGSHEPRKNHLAVLEAAESLWSDGVDFSLVFIGGSGWRSERFDLEIERLTDLERPVLVRRGASETELWAAYRLARFTVFPSLVEGYGLPIVESIASGTPVITTNYGSMAEIGEGGGAVLVDPYDAGALADEMRRLLFDDDVLEEFRKEADQRQFPSWDEYAEHVWSFFTGER